MPYLLGIIAGILHRNQKICWQRVHIQDSEIKKDTIRIFGLTKEWNYQAFYNVSAEKYVVASIVSILAYWTTKPLFNVWLDQVAKNISIFVLLFQKCFVQVFFVCFSLNNCKFSNFYCCLREWYIKKKKK